MLDMFPKYLVLKCLNMEEIASVMQLNVKLPLAQVAVTTDLNELGHDKTFTEVATSHSVLHNMHFEDIEASNLVIDEPSDEIQESPKLQDSSTNSTKSSPIEVKEEPMSPVKDEEQSTSTNQDEHEQFRRAFQNDHCYTKQVKDEPEVFRLLEEMARTPVYPVSGSVGPLNGRSPPEQRTPMQDISRKIDMYQIRQRYQRTKKHEEPGSVNGKRHSLYQSVQCQMCHTSIAVKGKDWHSKSAHAIIHSNIERYHCPICELYGSRHRAEVVRHIQRVHELTTTEISIKEDMSPEDILQLRNMVSICFGTQINKNGKLQTQLLNFYEQQLDDNKVI